MQRVIITTGGTGGHIFPALSVAEEIRRRYPRAQLLFLGGQYGPEADLAVKAGLDFTGLPVRGVTGRGVKGAAALVGMLRGVAKALGVIRKFQPQMVVGFGGYAAFAGVLAAFLGGKRTAIHEQNAFPGLTNRILGRLVKRIFLAMPDASGSFPAGKCLVVGNPVRSGIVELYENKRNAKAQVPAGRAPRLLVIGGSQGARALNESMNRVFEKLLEAGVEIRHQTGKTDYERIRAAYREAGAEHVRVEAFIADMPRAYEWADLVLSRAGASSLAEITAAGLPSILVPFPQAARDHQRHNALYMRDQGAAVLLEQKEFYGEGAEPARLADCVIDLLKDTKALQRMAERSLALAKPYAAAGLVDGLETLLMR